MFGIGANVCVALGFLIMKQITDNKLKVDPEGEEEWQIYFNYDPNVQATRLLAEIDEQEHEETSFDILD